MYYINAKPTDNGNHGNPTSRPYEGCVAMPDDLLTAYIEAKGFVIPTLEKTEEIPASLVLAGVTEFYFVTRLAVNYEAFENYMLDHPDQAEAEPEPTETEQLRADIDFIAAMTGIEL